MAFGGGNFVCTSFKQELLQGMHNFTVTSGHTFKFAMYDNTPTFNAGTTAYTSTNEMPATGGYSTGGATLVWATATPTTGSGTAWADFDDYTYSSSTITGAYGALLYNSTTSPGTKTCVVLDFGGAKTSSAGNFVIQFPPAAAGTAIIRIA